MNALFKISARMSAWIYGNNCSLHRSSEFNVPVRLDGCGDISIGAGVSLGYRKAPMLGNGRILLQARTSGASISIGSATITSNNVSIISCDNISIGAGCQIGDQVTIIDSDFHEINPENRKSSGGKVAPVVIGDNVWLGSRVMVLKGVTIGHHCVVAAGSVVTKSIPARCLAAGSPAKVIRKI